MVSLDDSNASYKSTRPSWRDVVAERLRRAFASRISFSRLILILVLFSLRFDLVNGLHKVEVRISKLERRSSILNNARG